MNKIYPMDDAPSCVHSTLTLVSIFFLSSVFVNIRANAQVNAYARVTSINSGKTVLNFNNLNQSYGNFSNGSQVIVIQMQDNVIGNTNASSSLFGSLGSIQSAGLYEVATIQTFNSATSQMTLTRPLKNVYHTDDNSRLQVVSFNQMGNPDFTTTKDIRALKWNGNIGGVVAFQVTGTLNLQHTISADSAGFRGGAASANEGLDCENGLYASRSNNYGRKGEGIYRVTNGDYEYARGCILNGGGGGNGHNGGGGGGGNISGGGLAGTGFDCRNQQTGGLGGIALLSIMSTGNRLLMGGGGGGGQGNNENQSSGGNGGGIVIVKANRIRPGGNFTISANGASAASANGDGAGGGGAAGSVLLQVNNYDVSQRRVLVVTANGGSGGDVTHSDTHGGGGGGGQGAILFSGIAPTGNVLYTTLNGLGGDNNAAGSSQAGNGTGAANQGILPAIGTPLPVKLLNFNAAKSDNKTKLMWTTTDELNTVFNVEHSTDGVSFTTVGVVFGTGTANAITNYNFTHNTPASGNNFYRLQMTEVPAFRTYSSIATVAFNDLLEPPVAWPNPVKDHFEVRLAKADNNTMYEVTICDLAGKPVFTSSQRPVNNIIRVHTGDRLRRGLYIASIATDTQQHFVKLIVQ